MQAQAKKSFLRLAVTFLVLVTGALPLAAQCHDHQGAEAAPAAAAQGEALGAMSIPDTTVLDQDGHELHFYSDLIEGRVVAINFIFTTCTTICPPMGANFGKLQKLLAESASGNDLQMISVSVDPAVDTPQRLKKWSDKFGRRPGWTLVTGNKVEIDQLLKALKVFTPDKTDHSPIVLLGDDTKNEWTRAYGLAPAATLAEMAGALLAASEEEAGR